jgi:DeoR family transcriptional regulator, aga operon transcriptional repressor
MQQNAYALRPELSTVEREWKIMAVLRERGTVNVAALADTFQVSVSTIRRDLDKLEKDGFLTKVYGGAYLRESQVRERPLAERLMTQPEAKEEIAIAAAALIEERDTLIIGSGTTCCRLARNFPADQSGTVVTNDLRVATELCQRPKVTVIMTGGQILTNDPVAYGSIAEHTISRINADKAFFSVMGFSLERGLTHALLEIASYKRRVISAARQLVVLVDSHKIGKVFPYLITSLNELHTVVTDEDSPSSFVSRLRSAGVEVIVAKRSNHRDG